MEYMMKNSKLITTIVCSAFITLALSIFNLSYANSIKANKFVNTSNIVDAKIHLSISQYNQHVNTIHL